MAFPLASKRWVRNFFRDEFRAVIRDTLQGRQDESIRANAEQLRYDLDLLLLHSKRIDESVQALTNLAEELKLYSHKNVHDLRNLIMILQSTVDELREMIDALPEKLRIPLRTNGIGADELGAL